MGKHMDDTELEEKMNAIIFETTSVLLKSGISQEEIINEFGSLTDPSIGFISMALIDSEFGYKSDAKDVFSCIGRAFVGVELHEGFWKPFTNRRTLLKAVGKLASRTLGVVGVALVVADFAICMTKEA